MGVFVGVELLEREGREGGLRVSVAGGRDRDSVGWCWAEGAPMGAEGRRGRCYSSLCER